MESKVDGKIREVSLIWGGDPGAQGIEVLFSSGDRDLISPDECERSGGLSWWTMIGLPAERLEIVARRHHKKEGEG